MPSRAIRDAVAAFANRRASRAGKPPPSLDELRAHFAPGGAPFPMPADAAVSPVTVAGSRAHWIVTPGAKKEHVVLFLHGGGYSVGSLTSHGELAARVGRATGARVLFLEYPLAPEHPFPAAVDATLAAWRALRGEGLASSSMVTVGDSAGAGLALAVMTTLRDANEPLPAAAALLSPFTDLTVSGASITARAGRDPIFVPEMVRQIAAGYLAGADPRAPQASPLFASLAGLPPLLVQVGSEELLFSDAERLVEAAKRAGVQVTFQIGEGLFHVYQSVANAPEATRATDEIGRFLRARL